MPTVAAMENRLYRLSWACALMVMCISPAGADPYSGSLDFALHLSRLKVDLNDGQRTAATTVKHAGIASFNLSNAALQPGLSLGYAYIDTTDQPLTAGMELKGFYIGPALRGALIDGRTFTLSVTGSYLYQRVRDSNTTQAVTLEWYQPQLDLDAVWHISASVGLAIGGQFGRVDVDERIEGTVNQTLKLKRNSTFGGVAGVEFDLGGDGRVGVLLHQAVGDGAEIYFQRQF